MKWPWQKRVIDLDSTQPMRMLNMSTSTTESGWKAFLSMLETDVLTVGGVPLQTCITAMIAANGNLALEAAALLQFNAAAPAAGITLAVDVQNQLLQLALTKLQALMAAKPATAAA